MVIKYRNSGQMFWVSTDEGRALISSGIADEVFVDLPAKKRENALDKRKKEKR